MRSHFFVVALALVCLTLSASACPIDVTPTTLPNAVQGSAYSQTLSGNGGTGPYNFTLESGSLPAGVTIGIDGTLAGTPTALGSSNFTVFVVDSASCNVSQEFLLTVSAPACTSNISVSPVVLASGVVGQAYSVIMSATGGSGLSYNFTVSSGALPSGINLSNGGTLSGTPTEAGVFSLTITATDASGCSGSRDFNLTTSCSAITVNPTSIAPSLGNPISITLTATGGAAPYTFDESGTLPTGLTLTDGVISGTPSALGQFNFTITATDNSSCTGQRNYAASVQSISITAPDSLPDTALDTGFSVTFVANGTLSGPFTFSGSNLPSGLSISSAGVLSGSPHTYGSLNGITIIASAGGYSGARNYSLNVNSCPENVSITPTKLDNAISGETYTDSISTSSGQGFYDISLPSGGLPTGLSVGTNGAVTGTTTQTGDFTFNVTATRRNAPCGTISGIVTLHVCAGWSVLLRSNLTEMDEGDSLNANVALSDSNGNDVSVDWQATVGSGSLPTGVSLNTDGTLTGTATEAGTYTFTVVIKVNSGNDVGCEYTGDFSITINSSSSAARLTSWLSL